ncbi:hypothetical protein [Pseudoalteromonas spongiae]|uniref:hypothetical protein n=1 Tax=Pseudoalteromonas spongiae TaxID=298657 RepID=UPI000C2D1CD2|nr:hypothetical protein [Pseudoalteromonas spongiae]
MFKPNIEVNTAVKANAVVKVNPLLNDKIIEKLNTSFDDIFAKQKASRRYVDAKHIQELGLLNDIFNKEVLSLIYSMFDKPVLYHCHAYEIDGKNNKSHISSGNFLRGWHRDVDCRHRQSDKKTQHVSLFVYLTDVGEADGAFEISDKPLSFWPYLFKSSRYYRLIGQRGFSFLFNRTAVHRASPNRMNKQRRVLKISFQDSTTVMPPLKATINSNDKKIRLSKVLETLDPQDFILRSLFGDKTVAIDDLQRAKDTFLLTLNKDAVSSCENFEISEKFSLVDEFRGIIKDYRYLIRLKLQ